MKIGINVDASSPREAIDFAILAERSGFHSCWLIDHLRELYGGNMQDPWSIIGGIAFSTKRISIGTSVTDAIRIHPVKLAQIVSTISQLSRGRAILGIGAGEAMNVVPFGMPFGNPEARVGRLREAIQIMRLLWGSHKNNKVSFDGEFFKFSRTWLDQNPSPTVPIYVGAMGAKRTLALTGELADGWIPWLNTNRTFRARYGIIRECAIRAHRNPDTIDYVVNLPVLMSKEAKEERRAFHLVKEWVVMERAILSSVNQRVPRRISYQTLLSLGSARSQLRKLKALVTDDLASQVFAQGSPREVADRVEEFRKSGATHVKFELLDPGARAFRKFGERYLPLIS